MTFADRLRELRIRKNMTQGELSKATGLTQSAIAMYETGKREPKIEVMELLADYFNVDMNYITGKTDKTTMLSASAIDAMDVIKIPLLGRVVAGDPQEAIQEADEFLYIPAMNHRRSEDYFALSVNGESMEPNLMDGDIHPAGRRIRPDCCRSDRQPGLHREARFQIAGRHHAGGGQSGSIQPALLHKRRLPNPTGEDPRQSGFDSKGNVKSRPEVRQVTSKLQASYGQVTGKLNPQSLADSEQ